MAKQSGLGDGLLITGVDVSGDIQSLEKIAGGVAALEVTSIDQSARARIGGLRDGSLDYTAYFDPDTGGIHEVVSVLPTTDVVLTYCRGRSQGDEAAVMVAKQMNYDGKRGNDGSYLFTVAGQANGYGLQWGTQLTGFLRTDTAATNGPGLDQSAATSHGAQAFLHVTGVTGTSVTVTIEDSADGSSWAPVTGLAFTAATGPGAQRLATAGDATIRRHVRAVTTGTFTSGTFAVALVRNTTAVGF